MTDPIADLLTRIKNALRMHHEQVAIPHSKLKEAVLRILKQEGFIHGHDSVGEGIQKSLVVQLKYLSNGAPAITTLKRLSHLSRRVFAGYKELKPLRSGFGLRILSTPKGVLSDTEARDKKLGGEILIEVW